MVVCSLFSLYNLLPSLSGKALVYRKALELAAAGKTADCVVPTFKNIDAFVAYWGVGKPEQRDLFLAITRILKDQKGCDTHCYLLPSSLHFFNQCVSNMARSTDAIHSCYDDN